MAEEKWAVFNALMTLRGTVRGGRRAAEEERRAVERTERRDARCMVKEVEGEGGGRGGGGGVYGVLGRGFGGGRG